MKSVSAESLINLIEDCQSGNDNSRNTLIEQYLPFIVKTTSTHLNRYIEVENNDELTIAMIAFDEAISKYNSDKGGFISFAEILIKNRLIDYQRSNDKEILISYDDPNSTIGARIANKENMEDSIVEKNEILAYAHALDKFGLNYETLIEASPKHKKTRITAMHIGKDSSFNIPIVDKLYETKRLPITKIAKQFSITIKIIKRSKAIITSVIVAYVEKFDSITNWIDQTLKDEDHV